MSKREREGLPILHNHLISLDDFAQVPDGDDEPSPPSPGTAGMAFAASCLQRSESPKEVEIICETSTCVGGTWLGGTMYEPCIKRKQTNGIRHAKSAVCTVHHNHIKCEMCPSRIHEGCHVPTSSGYTLPVRGVPWTCLECTLKSVSEALDSKKGASVLGGGTSKDSDSESLSTSLISSKNDLIDTLRQMRWKIRSGYSTHIYCQCAEGLCKTQFKAKCVDPAGDTDGMWRTINMPSVHECSDGKRSAMPVTSRVCHLPTRVYQEIQMLACCKAFRPSSIQQFIKQKHGTIVDTTLIYNIGYRARSKLGIGDMEQLFSQQKVTVYTFSNSSDT